MPDTPSRTSAATFVDRVQADGRILFTTAEATAAIGASENAVRAQLRRLVKRGHLAQPLRSHFVVVVPQYRSLGCPPADHFVDALMAALGEPYYVALLSAAERHGAAHQRPQALQLMVRANRPAIGCGGVRIEFNARADVERMPTVRQNTQTATLRLATAELTALELVGYPSSAGGLSNAATVIAELAGRLDHNKLDAAARLSPVGWSQRLGHLLDANGHSEVAAVLLPYVAECPRNFIPLLRSSPLAGAVRDTKWRVLVNEAVEIDA